MASRSFVLLVADRRDGDAEAPARLGVTVSRRVGGAVVRTRVKRLLREWFRRHRSLFPKGKDIVVVARPAAAEARGEEIGRDFELTLGRLADVSGPGR
jgi:ribonuclease P protein component